MDQDSNDIGKITFKKHGKRRQIHRAIKLVVVVGVAFISGACGASYVIDSKLSADDVTNKLFSNSPLNAEEEKTIDKPQEQKPVVDEISPCIVGISTSRENFTDIGTGKITSGVIMNSEGYIVTNYSSIENAADIYVKIASQGMKPIKSKLLYANKPMDVAVLKVDVKGLPTIKLADMSNINIGDKVIAVGNPLGEENSPFATQGIISSCGKMTQKDAEGKDVAYKVFKTDAKINQYNQGGMLCNENGEAIGIISPNVLQGNSSDNIGIAIDIREITEIITKSKSVESGERPTLGLKGGDIKSSNKSMEGVYVQEVLKGQPLYNAGVKPTDVILEFAGKKVRQFSDLISILNGYNIGDEVGVKVWRNGEYMNLKVRLTEKK